jgi:hypothetical protein
LLDASPKAYPSDSWDYNDWLSVTLNPFPYSKYSKEQSPSNDKLNLRSHGVILGPVLSQDNNSITFYVDVNKTSCFAVIPFFEIFAGHYFWINPGQGIQTLSNIENLDSIECLPSNFSVQYIAPQNWNVSFTYGTNLYLTPNQAQLGTIYINSPPNASSGDYQINLSIVNMNNGKASKETLFIHVN